MAELFERTGAAEFDDAMALLERAYSCIDRAMGSLEDAGEPYVNDELDRVLGTLRVVDEALH